MNPQPGPTLKAISPKKIALEDPGTKCSGKRNIKQRFGFDGERLFDDPKGV